MSVGRNDKCPCGSGKKYKNCCMQKDLEQARHEAEEASEEPFEENPAPKIPTWKIVVCMTCALAVLFLIFAYALDMPRAGGSIAGVGLLILVFYAAFRNAPTLRKDPGDAGNIDFGKRQGIQSDRKK